VPARTRYLVELAAPSDGWRDLQQITGRARAEAEAMSGGGLTVRFVRSIYVPEDESCFFLYEGDSIETVREAGRRAQLQVARIEEAVQAGSGEEQV
jgi:uncharacterized protein DUF4242